MAEWKQYAIGDVCNTISNTYRRKDEEVVLVNTSDVFDGKILNHETVKNINLKGQFKKTFKKYDILYSEIRPANRRFAFVDFDDTDIYIASTKLMVLRPNMEIIEPRYLYAILSSQSMIDELQLRAESRSGTFPQITFAAELSPIIINIPDLDTQRRIVKVLDDFERKMEINDKIKNNLNEQMNAVFEEMFITNADSSWLECRIGDFLELERGLSYKGKFLSEDEGVPMLNLGNILPNSVFRPEKLKFYTGDFKEKNKVKPGDVIVANTDLTQAREVLGSAIRVPDLGYPTMICSHHISIVRNSRIAKSFIMGLLNLPSYRERVAGYATGTTVLALPNDTILNCEFKCPPNELLEKYDAFAESIYRKLEEIRIENEKTLAIRNSLLPGLLCGELSVENIWA